MNENLATRHKTPFVATLFLLSDFFTAAPTYSTSIKHLFFSKKTRHRNKPHVGKLNNSRFNVTNAPENHDFFSGMIVVL
jgi:hypothetical protein